MHFNFDTLTASDWAAWYAAIVSTVVLVFEVWKWHRERAQLEVVVSPTSAIIPDDAAKEDFDSVWVRITNTGRARTTVTHLVYACFPPGLSYPFRRIFDISTTGRVTAFRYGSSFPVSLEPGEVWVACTPWTERLHELHCSGILYFRAFDACSQRFCESRTNIIRERGIYASETRCNA